MVLTIKWSINYLYSFFINENLMVIYQFSQKIRVMKKQDIVGWKSTLLDS